MYKGKEWVEVEGMEELGMSIVFAGTYAHNMDGKCRTMIPACFREHLSLGFTIALNTTIDALAIYPPAKWEEINDRLSRVRETDDEAMDYLRLVMANAQPNTEMDAQGRVLLPSSLRDFVGITRAITFVGMRDHIEVWDTEAFTEKVRVTREKFAALRKHVNEVY